MSKIALIPARGGSERVKHKNIRNFCGHPLIAYTIAAAKESRCFDRILVSSDDTATLDIAARHGADCVRRPEEFATATSPDIEWVGHALKAVSRLDAHYDTFSILRPTSPFRSAQMIKLAFEIWGMAGMAFTSLRAMEPVSQHPGKMWLDRPDGAQPLLLQPPGQPFHDSQMASLPEVYVQNASLEIAHSYVPRKYGTISGDRVYLFEPDMFLGFDINTQLDWDFGEWLVENKKVELPDVS